MNKLLAITIFLLFNFFNLYSQSAGSPSSIPNVIPPSPNASALEKFTSIPVDYSTGVPSISYQFWSWQRNRLNYSVGVNYHAGGYIVETMASNVGLGWAFTGGGRVTRTVRGIYDDRPNYGFIHTSAIYNGITNFYQGDYQSVNPFVPDYINPNIMITKINSTASNAINQLVKGELDGEQDIFSISFNGISCRFVLDRLGNIQPLEKTNLKIEKALNTSGHIQSFTVIDDKGIIYIFDQIEKQEAVIISEPATFSPANPGYTSGWLISKVYDPLTHESIDFHYSSSSISKSYETGFSQSQTQDFGVVTANQHVQGVGRVWAPPASVYTYSIVELYEPTLSKIDFPDGSSLNFIYDLSRLDFSGDNALTQIDIRNSRNAVIKSYKLNYSYFSCPSQPISFVYNSANDYSKRLRLDNIDEISAGGLKVKRTSYTYNSILLNRRDSRNIDYWGYNINPARNNLELIPKIPIEQPELLFQPAFGAYFDGADRSPDEQFSKAGVLEKITYPTGGFTSFEFECNKAYSPVNYYENTIQSNILNWTQGTFNQDLIISFPTRTEEPVEFLFKTDEYINPRPPGPGPNEPHLCIGDGQDLIPASFEINSTDGQIGPITVTDTYENFHYGVKRTIILPLEHDYTVKFIYDDGSNCAFFYPFSANCSATYFEALHDKLVGGVRIKKIISNDGVGNLVSKEYNYNNADGNSSATLNIIPNFGYHRVMYDAFCSSCPWPSTDMHVRQISRSSSPIAALDMPKGSPLIYTRVIETETDGSSIERHYDPVYMDYGITIYPYLPIQQHPQLDGLLLKEIIKTNTGEIKKSVENNYEKILYNLSGLDNLNIVGGRISYATGYSAEGYVTHGYAMKVAHANKISSVTKFFENGEEMFQTENYEYDPVHYYLTAKTTTNSKGIALKSSIQYTFNIMGGVYTNMLNANMLAYPYSNSVNRVPVVLNDPSAKNHVTSYALFPNNTLPMPSSIRSSVLNNPLETDITFQNYDEAGNLLQYTARDGVTTSLIWGYKKQYPVAKIIGASYAQISGFIDMNVINNPLTTDDQMRNELNNIRIGLAGTKALVNTYTYLPLVGMSSQSDPNGKTSYYEYDEFSRLKLIRDQDNNIIKSFDYKYSQ